MSELSEIYAIHHIKFTQLSTVFCNNFLIIGLVALALHAPFNDHLEKHTFRPEQMLRIILYRDTFRRAGVSGSRVRNGLVVYAAENGSLDKTTAPLELFWNSHFSW